MLFKTIFLSSTALLMTEAERPPSLAQTEAYKSQLCKHGINTHEHHAGYIKPGAAIALTHDYDGQTAVGEFETITLTLNHIYENGNLSIDILPTEGLQVFSDLPLKNHTMQTNRNLSIPIQFSGMTNGIYSIAVEAVYESPEGQQSRRVISVPITVGTRAANKSQPITPQSEKSNATGLITLPAKEVIR